MRNLPHWILPVLLSALLVPTAAPAVAPAAAPSAKGAAAQSRLGRGFGRRSPSFGSAPARPYALPRTAPTAGRSPRAASSAAC